MRSERPPIAFVPPSARTRAALALGCHGNPDRCLTLTGRRLPICARCTGLVVGNAIAAASALTVGLPDPALAVALLVPLAVDGVAQASTAYRSTNVRRLSTGIAAGVGQFSIAIAIFGALLRFV